VDYKEFIASGILESYVLGITSPDENDQVEEMALKFPEVKSEIAAIEESFGKLADASARTPAPAIKDNIFSKIRALEKEIKPENGKVVSLKMETAPKESQLTWWAAAAIALFIISSALNILLYNKWKNAEVRLAVLNDEKEEMANLFKTERTSYEQTAKDMSILKQPGNKSITLKGSKIAPEAVAVVFWNDQSHEVWININELPAPPSDKQYQLWAIVDGNPVSAGMVEMQQNNKSLQKMSGIDHAQAFAITLEKKGGSSKPDLNSLYVIGNV
jgi:anti-sigma-K factor RskA